MTHLFDTYTIRELTIPNRIWLSPMCQYQVNNEDGVPNDWHLVHYGARATGGFGFIITEAAAVAPEGRISARDVGIWNDKQIAAWQQITGFVHSQGSTIGIQLAHAGRKASIYPWLPGFSETSVPEDKGGWTSYAPSAIAMPGLAKPQELTLSEVEGIPELFAQAAKRSVQAGFDVIEIHAAHGYLLHQFLSPIANKREDAYGGSFERRTRLVLEVATASRAVIPEDIPLFIRISATDWINDQPSWDLEQSLRLALLLRQRGVDLIDVSSGGVYPASVKTGPSYQAGFATEIHRHSGLPTTTVGEITDAAQAEGLLVSGDIAAVFIGRAALREAAWPQRAAFELDVDQALARYPGSYLRGAWSKGRG